MKNQLKGMKDKFKGRHFPGIKKIAKKERLKAIKEKFKKNKKLFWGSVVGCIALVAILTGGIILHVKGSSKNQTEMTVQSTKATTGSISNTVEGTGTISNGATTDVLVPTGIKVEEVKVESGDTVKKGQVLATLDEASIASELLEVKENIESVEDEIEDLSSDAQTTGTTEYLKAKVLNAELEELEEAKETLTDLLETPTITATCSGTISSVNVSEDTEITGSSSTGNGSGTSTGNTNSVTTTSSTSSSASASSKTTTTASASSVVNTSSSGSYSLMLLNTGANSQATESSLKEEKNIASTTINVTAPSTGQKPQTTIKETDQYTATITWNCKTTTFEKKTSYTATICLTAKEGYTFSDDTKVKISGASVTTKLSENKSGESVLTIKATFAKTGDDASKSSTSTQDKTNTNQSSNATTSKNTSNSVKGSSGTSSQNSGTSGIASAGTSGGTSTGTNGAGTSGTSGGTASTSGTGTAASSSSSGTTNTGNGSSSEYSMYETAAFSIASSKKATVSINVDELDITSVKEGQTATITLDAIEGQEFTGTITSVSSEASSGSSSAKYPVEITFEKTDDMRVGMTASATIAIEEADNAVLIPVDALQEKGNKTFVYTKKDSDGNLSGEVEVETGLSNGSKVQITSGLEDGDTVYYLKTTSNKDSDSNQMPGGQGGEAPSGDMPSGGQGGGQGGEAPSGNMGGGPGGNGSQSGSN